MSLAQERMEEALKDAQTYLEMYRAGAFEWIAYELLSAAQKVYGCDREIRREAEADALAKEMGPQP